MDYESVMQSTKCEILNMYFFSSNWTV